MHIHNRNYILHEVRYLKSGGFQPTDLLAQSDIHGRIRIGPVTVRMVQDRVETSFAWSWHDCGAPKRKSHRLFDLTPEHWGRFKFNGRFGAESTSGDEWRYHKSAYNIAFGNSFELEVFVASNPDSVNTQMSALW